MTVAALDATLATTNTLTTFQAWIRRDNDASLRIFGSCGFRWAEAGKSLQFFSWIQDHALP